MKTPPQIGSRVRSFAAIVLGIAAVSAAWAQEIAPPPAPVPPAVAPGSDETVVLSPFEVQASADDVGYYASQSLSGTRLNSKIEDLASSITVVTKQQLLDTAALDVNDIFLYESNTEGTHQYTEFVNNGQDVIDTVAQSPQTANRVRGMGAANIARGNFAASSAIPVDTYNLDAVEISRGPNSNIFGLGEASGTVNLISSSAHLTREASQVSFRTDDRGSWRTAFDLNRPVIRDALAIRIFGVAEEQKYVRQPAVNKTNRLTVAATAKPFRKTTLRVSYETYDNFARRPNSSTLRDAISEWFDSGQPRWNPATLSLTFADGRQITGITKTQEIALLPPGIIPQFNTFLARPSFGVDPDGEVVLYHMNAANTGAGVGFNGQVRLMQSGTIFMRGGGAHGQPLLPLYQTPGVSDRRIYDYEKYNVFAPNHSTSRAGMYRVELEQWFIEDRRQRLALQAGFFREDVDTMSRSFIGGSDGAPSIMRIDINETLIDGSPNPHFLRPYIIGSEPQIQHRPELNDNYRATLAYELDLSRETGWIKWLGRNRFAAYGELREIRNANQRSRDRIVSDEPWMAGNALLNLSGRGADSNLSPRYHLGGPLSAGEPYVQHAPAAPREPHGDFDFTYYQNATNLGPQTATVESVTIGEVFFNGSGRKREVRTRGLVWQGFFWGDRLVPTLGWRRDKLREAVNLPLVLDPTTRMLDPSGVWNFEPGWRTNNEGSTKTRGVVVKPLSWLNLHYNESDSFLPEESRWNVYLEPVANPTGEGKDHGFSVNLFDGKVIARINQYETVQRNGRSPSGAIAQRLFNLYFDPNNELALNAAGTAISNGLNPFDLEQQSTNWMMIQHPDWTLEQARSEAVRQYLVPGGITEEFIDTVRQLGGGSFTEVNTVTSKGLELELNYNPTPFWTIKLTGAKQQAVDSEMSPNFANYIGTHLPYWQSVQVPNLVDPDTGEPIPGAGGSWFNTLYGAVNVANMARTWFETNVQAPYKLNSANAGKPRPQTREWRFNATTNFRLSGITEHRYWRNLSVGGAVRWEDKASVGFMGAAPDPDGAIREYDPNRPIYDQARTYVDLLAQYDLRLFDERVRARLQLNVRNVFESGRLQEVAYNPDGTPWNFRIIDPRQFILTATFDL